MKQKLYKLAFISIAIVLMLVSIVSATIINCNSNSNSCDPKCCSVPALKKDGGYDTKDDRSDYTSNVGPLKGCIDHCKAIYPQDSISRQICIKGCYV